MANSLYCLIIDGYPKVSRDKFGQVGMCLAGQLYANMLWQYQPDAKCDIKYVSDPEVEFPDKQRLKDYDAILWPGCNLTIFDTKNRTTRKMIDLVKFGYELGIPQFGSCWGIQIAVYAIGGEVKVNPKGREMGIARKIHLTKSGQDHPMFEGKPPVFDAFISHEDEITKLPSEAQCLASNDFTSVQAVSVKYKEGIFWATQYHPEYDLHEVASLTMAREKRLIDQGFFGKSEDCQRYVNQMKLLHAQPQRKDLRWQLAIDDDLLSDQIKHCEFVNWLNWVVLPRKLKAY